MFLLAPGDLDQPRGVMLGGGAADRVDHRIALFERLALRHRQRAAMGPGDPIGLLLDRRRPHVGGGRVDKIADERDRSEEHTSELQSLMRISYAVFCLKKKTPLPSTLLSPLFTFL